jgi:glycosyltransferase involved in cell wall biosynthesis
MRLAFVALDDAEDVGSWSGIPYHVLQEIRRHGLDVVVISPLERPFKYCYAPQKIVAKLSGKSIQINRHPLALRSFAGQIDRRLRGKKFDAVIAMSSVPIARLHAGIPVLYWTDAVIEGISGYYGGPFANLSRKEMRIAHDQEQAALDRASFAIYSSDWAAQIVKSHYKLHHDHVNVIEFGANLSISHDENDILQFSDNRLNQECVLLFIGVDWERKGGVLAFEAAKLLNERGIRTVLKVVGCDAPEAPFVQRLGFVGKSTPEGRQALKELFTTATFFILPARAEAAGIVFCEAAAYGLPVLSTRTGGVENYVKHEETGYCLPLTATGSEYADVIASTLANPDTYRRLSLSAFQRYKGTLNWDVAVSSLLRFTERAVAGTPAA